MFLESPSSSPVIVLTFILDLMSHDFFRKWFNFSLSYLAQSDVALALALFYFLLMSRNVHYHLIGFHNFAARVSPFPLTQASPNGLPDCLKNTPLKNLKTPKTHSEKKLDNTHKKTQFFFGKYVQSEFFFSAKPSKHQNTQK
jgi:hypothetical protein